MEHEKVNVLMSRTIAYARETNPIWPFASMITNALGEPLCLATDCAHISPLYHAESLAIHALINSGKVPTGKLRLFSTAEPDVLSQSAIYWAKITHDLDIVEVIYGSSFATIGNLWKFGIDISASEVAGRAKHYQIRFIQSSLKEECNALFLDAKAKQQGNHPARGILSQHAHDFYLLF